MKTVIVKQTSMNPDVRASRHLRETLHRGRKLSEERARRTGHQARVAGAVSSPSATAADATQSPTGPRYPVYTAPELRPYDGRPGAMDAFNMPSRINGQLRARRPPSRYTEADGRVHA